ncbi:hypothetical protein Leryth_004431 [Lithospermum erythrorhizon]|nr:hypothetical protein Leryth_004431 [Lithospermum erythrorhizon]
MIMGNFGFTLVLCGCSFFNIIVLVIFLCMRYVLKSC